MSWLTDFVKPKLRALVGREIPDNLWSKCPSCEQLLFHRDLPENLYVCRHCNYHYRMGARDRLASLMDQGQYDLLPIAKPPVDPLKFKDVKKYADRLKDARHKTGEDDAVLVASGSIGSIPVVVAVFDFRFMGGSMGMAVGNGLLAASNGALGRKCPLIVMPSSGGARMQEGILSLMQMPRTTIAISRVVEAKLPYITVLCDPTTGGVSASFAMLGDVTLAESGAIIGFAGARVIEQTMRESLPPDFQTADYLLDHGMVDRVVHRAHLRDELTRLLTLLVRKTLSR